MWKASDVHKILRDPEYRGTIVSEDLFDEVQQKLDGRVTFVVTLLKKVDGSRCVVSHVADYGDGDALEREGEFVRDARPLLQPGETLEMYTGSAHLNELRHIPEDRIDKELSNDAAKEEEIYDRTTKKEYDNKPIVEMTALEAEEFWRDMGSLNEGLLHNARVLKKNYLGFALAVVLKSTGAKVIDFYVAEYGDEEGFSVVREHAKKIELGEGDTIETFVARLELNFDELNHKPVLQKALTRQFARKLVRECILPPGTTPANLEVLAMSAAHLLCGLGVVHEGFEAGQDLERFNDLLFGEPILTDTMIRIIRELLVATHMFESRAVLNPAFAFFLHDWRKSSYARLEVSHKLAASLCLTDVPADIDVRAPWPAWSLVVPDGLLDVARVWLLGLQPIVALKRDGTALLLGNARIAEEEFLEVVDQHDDFQERHEDDFYPRLERLDEATLSMLDSLVKGCCLALRSPEAFEKKRSSGSKRRQRSSPNFDQARYLLSAPVKIDLREHVRALLKKGHGVGPKVQFLVRGHWRNQACGPKQLLRKTIWIEPFWKGPEGSRILLRSHSVEDGAGRTLN